MSPAEAWVVLGIAPTDDERAIKRAYSALLKGIDVDRDPEGFIRLREAMETARSWGTYDYEDEDEEDWEEPEGEDDETGDEDGPGRWEADEPAVPHSAGFAWSGSWARPGGWFTGLRPPLPLVADDGLAALCARIDRLLFDEAPPEDEARLREEIGRAGRALLKSPALQGVDTALAVENWLSAAIAAAIPRSDALAVPAINHWGWHRGGASWNRPAAVDAVLGRYEDRVWLLGPAAEAHKVALGELKGSPRAKLGWFELGRGVKVERFLKLVRHDHPSVLHDLEPASVAWWDKYLGGRRPPANFWQIVAVAPAALAMAAVLGLTLAELPVPGFALAYAAALAATLAYLAVDAELKARARRREPWEYRETGWREIGWAPVLLLLGLASGHRAGAAWLIAVALLSWAAGVWGIFRTDLLPSDDPAERRRRRGFPLIAGVVTLFVVLRMPGALAAGAVTAALSTLCWMGRRGYDAMARYNAELAPKVWTGAAAGLLAAHVAIGAVLAWTLPRPAATLLVAVPVLLIAQHWLLAGRYRELGRGEFAVRMAALAVYFTRGFWARGVAMDDLALGWLIAACAYGLMLSAACLAVSMRAEGVSPLPSRERTGGA